MKATGRVVWENEHFTNWLKSTYIDSSNLWIIILKQAENGSSRRCHYGSKYKWEKPFFVKISLFWQYPCCNRAFVLVKLSSHIAEAFTEHSVRYKLPKQKLKLFLWHFQKTFFLRGSLMEKFGKKVQNFSQFLGGMIEFWKTCFCRSEIFTGTRFIQ